MVSDSEALPWLEAVDDEDEPRGVSAGKMLMALVMVLVGVAIVAGTLFYLGREQAGSGPPDRATRRPAVSRIADSTDVPTMAVLALMTW